MSPLEQLLLRSRHAAAARQHVDHKMSPLEQLLLRKRAQIKDEAIAQAIGKDRSVVSRMFGGDQGVMLHDLEKLLSSLGLKVVPADTVTLRNDAHEALRLFAGVGVSCRCAASGGDMCGLQGDRE